VIVGGEIAKKVYFEIGQSFVHCLSESA
jgi:hypothetical protein